MNGVKIQLKDLSKSFASNGAEETVAVDRINLEIHPGEFFALLGPSGCGKSTTLRLIAGFEQPTSGEIYLNGHPIAGLPPHQRPVNTVFQDYALFPHMSVLENVLFGLKMDGVTCKEAQKRAQEALELVQLPQIARRKPAQLSGGQQQRVALARALVKRPSVLLLDEPLGALDLKLRRQMQLELKALQRELGITFIFVTHDQEEAMTMANRIAVMNEGHVLQVGRPDVIYEHPANRFVAAFVGETNFLHAQTIAHDASELTIALADTEISLPRQERPSAQEDIVTLAIRPERIQLRAQNEPNGHTPTHVHLPGRIHDVHYIGTDIRYVVALRDGQEITVRSQNTDPASHAIFAVQDVVEVFWKAQYTQVLHD